MSDTKVIVPSAQTQFQALMQTNSEVLQYNEQVSQHNLSLKNIEDLIKEFKGSHNKKMQLIIGKNFIVEKDNKWAIKNLMNNKEQMNTGFLTIKEQLERREDKLEGLIIKCWKILGMLIPEDVKSEIEEETKKALLKSATESKEKK